MWRNVALVLLLALPAIGMVTSRAHAQPLPLNPAIQIEYVEPASAELKPIQARLRDMGVLELLSRFLSPLRLPRPIKVTIEQCGALERPYVPGGPATVCLEYLQRIEQLAPPPVPEGQQAPPGPDFGSVVVGSFVHTMLRQVALALFETAEVPVWGREQDAADRLATFLMLQFGDRTAIFTLSGLLYVFESSQRTWVGADFADTRSTEAQRLYNVLCLVVGSRPQAFESAVSSDGQTVDVLGYPLPMFRAQRCVLDYLAVQKAFGDTLLPIIDPTLLAQVRATDVLGLETPPPAQGGQDPAGQTANPQ